MTVVFFVCSSIYDFVDFDLLFVYSGMASDVDFVIVSSGDWDGDDLSGDRELLEASARIELMYRAIFFIHETSKVPVLKHLCFSSSVPPTRCWLGNRTPIYGGFPVGTNLL